MQEENTYTPLTLTPSEEAWNGIQDFSPLATGTQGDITIEPMAVSVPPPIEPNPIGDALCPLLLLAAFYFSLVYLKVIKKRKTRYAIRK
jgi:hypothetical protein